MRSDQFLDAGLAACVGGGEAEKKLVAFFDPATFRDLFLETGVIVCDMNCPHEETIAIFEQFLAARRAFLESERAPPATAGARRTLVCLTFKNPIKGTFQERKRESIEKLQGPTVGLRNVQELHLFANTKNETTVVGEFFH